jgi:hypothetical protein
VRWGDGLTGCWACTLSVLVVIGSGAWIWCSTTEGILKLASLALTSKLDLGVSALHFGLGVWILYVECVVWMVRCSGKMVPCFRSGFEVEGEWDSGVVCSAADELLRIAFLSRKGPPLFCGPLICVFQRIIRLSCTPAYLTHQIGQSTGQTSARELSNGAKKAISPGFESQTEADHHHDR